MHSAMAKTGEDRSGTHEKMNNSKSMRQIAMRKNQKQLVTEPSYEQVLEEEDQISKRRSERKKKLATMREKFE